MGSEEDERDFFREAPARLTNSPASAPIPSVVAAPEKPKPPKSLNHGHRDRLRTRFREAGHLALADYEILEALLFRSIVQGDTKKIAKTLLERFGSLAEVLGAPEQALREVKGVGDVSAFDLKITAAAAHRMLKGQIMKREILSSWEMVLQYCRAAMAFEPIEHFRILFLDKKNALIADEVQQSGTVDHTPAYPREVAKRALELSATAIVLVHNHPSGDPTPSKADIDMTKTIVSTCKPLGIAVHDHLIIGKSGFSSMKGLLLI